MRRRVHPRRSDRREPGSLTQAARSARHLPQPAGTRSPHAAPAAPPHLGSRPARAAGPRGRCLAARRHCRESTALRRPDTHHGGRRAGSSARAGYLSSAYPENRSPTCPRSPPAALRLPLVENPYRPQPATAPAPLCVALAAPLEFKRPQPLPPSLRRRR